MKPFTTIAAIIFLLMACAHLYRLIRPFAVVIGGCSLPQWLSIIGVLVPAGLALMLWREAKAGV
jgi:hypothetical protein